MAQGKENSNFNQDQKSLTVEIVNYLAKPKFLITPNLHRQSTAANIASGNLIEAIQNLEGRCCKSSNNTLIDFL